uniref:Uncharacterized protein n=1 Tax=Tetraselmis sp. GSL018 TaxID=582737 RepID=A0A061RGQ2_9CHLO
MDNSLEGQVPNLYWQTITWERLRTCDRFFPLPIHKQVAVCGKGSYKYVRQDSTLWHALHVDVLTTRHIASALGLHEPKAAKRIGLPSSAVSLGSGFVG